MVWFYKITFQFKKKCTQQLSASHTSLISLNQSSRTSMNSQHLNPESQRPWWSCQSLPMSFSLAWITPPTPRSVLVAKEKDSVNPSENNRGLVFLRPVFLRPISKFSGEFLSMNGQVAWHVATEAYVAVGTRVLQSPSGGCSFCLQNIWQQLLMKPVVNRRDQQKFPSHD